MPGCHCFATSQKGNRHAALVSPLFCPFFAHWDFRLDSLLFTLAGYCVVSDSETLKCLGEYFIPANPFCVIIQVQTLIQNIFNWDVSSGRFQPNQPGSLPCTGSPYYTHRCLVSDFTKFQNLGQALPFLVTHYTTSSWCNAATFLPSSERQLHLITIQEGRTVSTTLRYPTVFFAHQFSRQNNARGGLTDRHKIRHNVYLVWTILYNSPPRCMFLCLYSMCGLRSVF